MSTNKHEHIKADETLKEKYLRWVEDPMGQVVVATGATIGSFGIVLGGIGAIHLAMH